jgi:hypothetical protein
MLTILESSKDSPSKLTEGVVEIFAKNSPILQNLPFDTIKGGALRYIAEETLPGIGFRGVNEAFDQSVGVLNPLFEPLVIAGGELDVDNFILRTEGEGRRTGETARKVKALSLHWTAKFIKGDSVTNVRELDGLQTRLVNRQSISAGSTPGGSAVSLFSLDLLASLVEGSNRFYIMNTAMKLRLSQASRDDNVGGHVTFTPNNFGQQIMSWNGIPVMEMLRDNLNDDILGFDEVAEGGGGATATSIYCVSFDADHLHGIQSGPVMVTDLGDIIVKPAKRTRVEWDCGIVIRHPWSAARLNSCADVPFVA